MFGWFKKDKKGDKNADITEEEAPDEKELEQQGYDPTNDKNVEEYKEEAITDFSDDYPGYQTLSEQEIFDLVKKYDIHVDANGEIRHEDGYKSGGRICPDQKIVAKLRSVGKYMLKQVGKKIITGSLNLTKISFPISAMIPKTALETSVHYTCLFPTLLNKAAAEKEPLERLKLVATSCIASFFYTNTFLKPLNPILGETLHGKFNDGTDVYCEQISHHPPISYIYAVGPNKSYKYYGYYDYDAKAGMNSVSILNKGKRWIEFADGQKIEFDFPNETYTGSFMGTLRQESYGKMKFIDQKNNLSIKIEFGKVKKRPSDYFAGKVYNGDKEIGVIEGTYLGYIDIDSKRYWDYTTFVPHKIQFTSDNLGSDHKIRTDLITLQSGNVKQAQIEKEKGEEAQRADRKNREAWEKQNKKEVKKQEKEQKKADKANN